MATNDFALAVRSGLLPQAVAPAVPVIVIPDFVALVVSVRKGGVVRRSTVVGLGSVTLPALRSVIAGSVALRVAVSVSVPIVWLRHLVVVAGLAHAHNVGDLLRFIEGGTSAEQSCDEEESDDFHMPQNYILPLFFGSG